MKNVTLDVADLVSIMDFAAVEKRLWIMPGVSRAAMNAGSNTISVDYDEGLTDPAQIAAEIEACGFHCRGEIAPRHVCVPESTIVRAGSQPMSWYAAHDHAAMMTDGHHHADAAVPAAVPSAAPHEAHATMKHVPDAQPVQHDEMAHEMGHGAGMDMQDMVKDMRNRFLISLVFTVPIFALDPMGLTKPLFQPPFGLSMDLTMFILASAAILYPV